MRKRTLLKTLALAALVVALAAGTALAALSPDPRFAPPKTYDNPGRAGQPQNVVKGDFDEDGVLDLAMSVNNAPNNAISLFKGKRDGTFTEPPRRFDAAGAAVYVVKGDFDGDGHLDLAVSDDGKTASDQGTVAVLFGSGKGTFGGRETYPSGGTQPGFLAAVDVDGDGDKDLAVPNEVSDRRAPNGAPGAGNVTIMLNNGKGVFKAGQSVRIGPEPTVESKPIGGALGLAKGDLDGDGDPDLLATNPATGAVVSLKNRGGRYATAGSVKVGEDPQQVVVGLLNSDRRPDFATANADPASSDVSVGLGRGDGTFKKTREFASGGKGSSSLVARDLNNDGVRDLAVSNFGEGPGTGGINLGVLTGRGDGTFRKPETFRVGTTPAGLTAGRFDRDDRPDLAVPNTATNKLSVLINTTPKG